MLLNVTLYDAVNIIHDVISTGNLYPYTRSTKFVFVGQTLKNKYNTCKVLTYIKNISNSYDRIKNCFAKARQLSFLFI